MRRVAPTGRDRGIALISALWGSAILAVIALSVLQLTRADAYLARSRADTVQLHAIADGVVNLVILTLLNPEGAQPPVDGTPFTVAFAGHEALVSVLDEAGKVDVNMANAATLAQVLTSVGADTGVAQLVAARILAWREAPRDDRRQGGVEEYGAAGYVPRNSLFQSVEELQLVLGMSPELYRRVAPLLTVYSQAAYIDPAFSPISVLNAFRSQSTAAEAMLRQRDEERLGLRPPQARRGATLGHAFSITAEVRGAAEARAVRTAVVRLTARRAVPLLVYRWS